MMNIKLRLAKVLGTDILGICLMLFLQQVGVA